MNMHKEALPYHADFPLATPVKAPEPFSMREFLSIFFKDGKRIAAAFLIPMILFIILSFVPTPKYEATATLLVKMGREYLYRPEVGDSNVQPVATDRALAVLSEVEIINSRDVKEQVIDQVGLERLYPGIANSEEDPTSPKKARALAQLNRQLEVFPVKDSNIIQVRFKHADPAVAADAVNSLVANYMEKRRSIYSGTTVDLAQNQVQALRDRLLDVETRIDQFKNENNIVSFVEQQGLLLNQRDALETKLKAADSALAEATGMLNAVRKNANSVKSDIRMYSETTRDDTLDSARGALLDLRLKEGEATAKYTDRNPVVVDIRNQIRRAEQLVRDIEAQKKDIVRMGRNPVRDTVETDLIRFQGQQQSAQASKVVLTKQLEAINGQLSALSRQQPKLDELMRERQIADNTYQGYVKKLEESKILAELARNANTNVSIVQKALPPVEKKNLQILILAIGFVLSACIALLVAFLSELLRGTYISPEKLQRSLGLPVLASIPHRDVHPGRMQLAT
jgi:uncharacterized protein involved in exopolysaccharide biosynthesis